MSRGEIVLKDLKGGKKIKHNISISFCEGDFFLSLGTNKKN